MKLVNNVMLHMNHLVAIEAVNFGTRHGLDEATMLDVVAGSTGRSWVTEHFAYMDDLLLEHRQQPLRLIQGQTQISDIAEVTGPVDFHDVHAPPLAFGADLHQPQNPGHAFPRWCMEKLTTGSHSLGSRSI